MSILVIVQQFITWKGYSNYAAASRAVKIEAEREITILESKIDYLQVNRLSVSELEKTVDAALGTLAALDNIYHKSDHYIKRKLIGSMYPEKFTIEDLKVRTAKPNKVYEFIYLITSKLSSNKNGTNDEYFRLSQEVIPLGLFFDGLCPCISMN